VANWLYLVHSSFLISVTLSGRFAVLTSLMAILVMAASAAVRNALAEGPVVLEGPTTLELGLIGGGLFIVYAVASRRFSRRRQSIATKIGMTAGEPSTPRRIGEEQQPSRGAA
jgi:hypothetical protein